MSKTVSLTNGMDATVDDCDYEAVSAIRWYPKQSSIRLRKCFYAIGYADSRRVTMHRFIMDAKVGDIVDHIDRDRLNNTRSNLRFVTAAQNASNRTGWGATGITGIKWEKSCGRFKAYISLQYKQYRLGSFASIEDAIAARDAASIRLHGEFGVLSRDDPGAIAAAKELRAQYLIDRSAELAIRRKPIADRNSAILALRAQGKTHANIAKQFGLTPPGVRMICLKGSAV